MHLVNSEGDMSKIINPICSFLGVITGSVFLNGSGIGYGDWYSFPEPISKVVVSIATMITFVKIFIFLSSIFLKYFKK